MKTIIKVYDQDYDFEYENIFLVDITKEEKEKIYCFMEEIRRLDIQDRLKKYGEESSIVLIEDYIKNNLQVLSFDRVDINCYEL